MHKHFRGNFLTEPNFIKDFIRDYFNAYGMFSNCCTVRMILSYFKFVVCVFSGIVIIHDNHTQY